jgi:hypothetical protein
VAPTHEGVGDRPRDTAHLQVVEPADDTLVTMLVRPDGYVAWAAERPPAADVRKAVADWCPPAAVTAEPLSS